MARSAAFFDLDRTLISGASAFPFGVEAWREGFVTRMEMARWTIAAISFKLIGDKGEANEEFRGDFLKRIAGHQVSSLNALSRAVLPKLVSMVRPESRTLLEMHSEAGRDTWIVSASPEPLVRSLAASLGMSGAIGTRGKIESGIYTGELDGPFVYGPGKAEAIDKLASDRGYDLPLCYAYSDSVSDLPMMEMVGHPVAVNPDSALEAVAHERGWPIVIFARKTKRAMAISGVTSGAIIATSVAYLLGRRHGHALAVTQRSHKRRR